MQNNKLKSTYKLVPSLFGKKEKIPTDWNFKKLSEIGEIIGGGTPDTTEEEYWNGKILWAIPTDITNLSNTFIDNTKRKISAKGLKESSAKLLPKGSILITSRATIGECAITLKQIATNQGFQNLICNSQNNNLFVFHAIKFNKKRLLRLAYGTTFLEVSKNEIKKIALPIPTNIKEQEKIASILSNIDSLICQTQKIIERTQKLKNGSLQKLLTKGIGHTKFKNVTFFPRYADEKIPESWKVERLEKLVKIIDYRGRTPPFSEKGIIHLRSNNIRDGKINFDDITYVTKETYAKYMTRGLPQENDVLFTTEGPLGEVAFVPKNFKFSLAQRIIVLRPKTKDLISEFLKYLLQSRMIKRRYEGLSTGTTLGGIASKWFTKLFLPFPSDIAEQEIISKTLLDIENKIDASKLEKQKLETLKKGLMQKLLTGQIRVRV